MKTKPITPYQRLLDDVREFAWKVANPHRKRMWFYPKARIGEGWSLTDLAERTRAADQLDYDVRLRRADEGLVVEYVKRPPERPW